MSNYRKCNVLLATQFLGLLVTGRVLCGELSFNREVQPILSNHCFPCHGPDGNARKAKLRLDTKHGIFGQTREGALVVSLDTPHQSELLRRINSKYPGTLMPPPESGLSLTDEDKQVLYQWVRAGAPWEAHWAFQYPVAAAVPAVKSSQWASNAVDRFVQVRLENVDLKPAPPASRERLLRRVTFDLTGLPPTLAELDSFAHDKCPGAYERVVDRLLASPCFGERMAWSWLDAARYADSNGFQGDLERTMWPWRDWVVRSINRNQPYDQFTVWQLAGDLLPNATNDQSLATGFCRNHMINGEGGRIAEENRVEYVFDQIETLGTVWLGLTVQCCRCHDHKFDALLQSDYYRLFAYFNQTPVDGGGGDPQTPPVLDVPSAKHRQQIKALETQLGTAAGHVAGAEESIPLAKIGQPSTSDDEDMLTKIKELRQLPAENRDAGHLQPLIDYYKSTQPGYAKLLSRQLDFQQQLDTVQAQIPRVMIMQDKPDVKNHRDTYILQKGLYSQRGETVQAGIPETLSSDEQVSSNRLFLAEWIVSEENPLAARVTVNRFWQMLFGKGLVETVDDFGVQGSKPSHPDLLDWLATEFVATGWDRKHLFRLIVTSSTYRQSARVTEDQRQSDPENRTLARGPRSRLPSWMHRDQALLASRLLVGQIGGRPVRPYQPSGVWEEATFGKKKYQRDTGRDLYRRSLYVFWRRIVGPTMFFDVAKRQTCSVKPSSTNTPLHALTTLNDVTYVEAARSMAQRLLLDVQGREQRIRTAFHLATSRRPDQSEVDILDTRFGEFRRSYARNSKSAQKLLAVGEMSRRTELDLADHAALTSVCLLLLNLDETLSK